MRNSYFLGMLLLFTLITISSVCAQTFPWIGNGVSNNWSEVANWNSPSAPPEGGSSNVRLEFALGSSSFAPNNDLAEDNPVNPNFGRFVLESLFLAGSSNPYSISGETLRFAGDASINALAGPHVVDNAIQIPVPLEVATSGQLELNGNLSGTGAMTKTGGGTLVLDGSNGNWSGDLDIQAGTVRFDPGDALSLNTNVHVAAGATADFSPQDEGFAGFSGEGHLEFGNSANMFSHFTTVETFSGTIAGANTHLRKQGPGTLILDGVLAGPANVSLDQLTLEGGSISLTGNAELNITGALTLEPGTVLTASGLLDVSTFNDVTVENNAQLRVRTPILGPANFGIETGGTFEVLSGATVAIDDGTFLVFSADDLFIDTGAKFILQNGAAATVGAGANTSPLALSLFAELEVTGNSTTYDGSGGMLVGDVGTGTLTIDDGGNVNTARDAQIGARVGSTGTVLVTGQGSTWNHTGTLLQVGTLDNGTLTIADGGRVENVASFVGTDADATGTVSVVGSGSTWVQSDNLFVGSSGTGTLSVEDGGSVSNQGGTVGASIGSVGNVTIRGNDGGGTPANWTSSAVLTIGSLGEGTMTIENGGTVTSAGGLIASGASSMGTVSVAGTGSTWTINANLSIGAQDGGTGTLTVSQEGTVSAVGDVVLFPDGLLRLDGGTLTAPVVRFEGGGQFDFLAGTLHTETFAGNLTNQGGILAPGNTPGQTLIDGDYTQEAAAILQIEIGGTQPEIDHDFVDVMGDVALNGSLDLALIELFEPDPASTFTILTSNQILGSFANVANNQRLATTDGGGSFLVHYGVGSTFDPTQIVLSDFQAALSADFDNDGDVDGRDFLIWQRGGSPNPLSATDLADWQGSYGSFESNAPAFALVPEPSALCLTMVTLASWLVGRCGACRVKGFGTSVVVLLFGLTGGRAGAITINLNYDPTGKSEDVPAVDANGDMLTDLIEYVASVYEEIIEDPHTINIRYRYQADVSFTNGSFAITDTGTSGGGGRTTAGLLRIRRTPDNDPARFYYYDPTPSDDSEFDMVQWLYDFGPNKLSSTQQAERFEGNVPALFEVGFRGEPIAGSPCDNFNCTDLLTILFHEVGHGLGLASQDGETNTLLLNETEIEPGDTTGDYDVDPNLVGGNIFGMKVRGDGDKNSRSHPFGGGSSNFAVMNSNTRQVRRRPSALDILAMASVANWTDLDLPRKEFLTGTSWNIGGNWLGGAEPGFGDEVFLRHGGSVFLAGPGRANDLLIAEDSQLITGANTLLAFGTVTVGGNGNGELLVGGIFGPVSNATVDAQRIVLSPTGTLRLDGNLTPGGQAVVTGTDLVLHGGTIITNSNSAAHINSRVDVATNTTLNVGSGASLALNNNLNSGGNLIKTGTGTLVIDGENESWTGDLIIDQGRVNVAPGNSLGNGTTVDLRSDLGIIDFAPVGHVQVFGGLQGEGTVLLGSDDIWFGANNADTVFSGAILPPLGSFGAGFVKLGTGTATLAGDALVLDVSLVSSREGGTLTFTDSARVTTSVLEATTGSIVRIEDNATVIATAGQFAASPLELLGGTFITTVFDGALFNQGGTVSPGTLTDQTRILPMSGNFVNDPNGSLQIDIGGLAPGDHDQLSLPIGPPGTGKFAGLGGIIDINLVDGYVPNLGDTFTIAKARFVSLFSSVLVAPVINGLTFELSAINIGTHEMHAVLEVIEATTLPADFDNDGDVDGGDFLIWQRGGSPNPLSSSDLSLWQTQYGSGAGPRAPTRSVGRAPVGAVPEPTTFVALVTLAAISLCGNRSFRSRRRSIRLVNLRTEEGDKLCET